MNTILENKKKLESGLYEIPDGWVWTNIENITLNPQYGWTTKATNSGDVKLLRTTDITSGNLNWQTVPYCLNNPEDIKKYELNDGDIVISRAGSVGFSYFIKNPEKSVFASYLIRFRPLNDEKYFYFFLKSSYYWKAISEESAGIAVQNVNATKLKKINFPLPPLSEQHRIVEKIEEEFTRLDAGVSALKKAKALIPRYRQAVLKAAMCGDLTEEWRAEHPDVESAEVLLEKIISEQTLSKKEQQKSFDIIKNTQSNELPKNWIWTTYNLIGKWSGGGTPSKANESYWNEGTIPWITPKDMKTLKIADSIDKINKSAIGNSAAKIIPSGSLLFVVRSGILRRTLPIAISLVDSTVNQDLKVLIPYKSLDREFLLYVTLAYAGDIRKNCAKDGTTVESIEVPSLRYYIIPLPPLPEQHEIVNEIERRFSVIDAMEKTVDDSLAKAERLRQSILKKAFEGRLVPQNPDDEPASVLLKRIQAEKKERAVAAKGKGKDKKK